MKLAGAGELSRESNVVELGPRRAHTADLSTVLSEARQGFELQAKALHQIAERLGAEYERALGLLFESRGRVVVCGIGKSGLIGRKLVATFVSTGTPSVFLHPAEALHGRNEFR
jgi:D-arabinose 5-phosphate isomerase GutQ